MPNGQLVYKKLLSMYKRVFLQQYGSKLVHIQEPSLAAVSVSCLKTNFWISGLMSSIRGFSNFRSFALNFAQSLTQKKRILSAFKKKNGFSYFCTLAMIQYIPQRNFFTISFCQIINICCLICQHLSITQEMILSNLCQKIFCGAVDVYQVLASPTFIHRKICTKCNQNLVGLYQQSIQIEILVSFLVLQLSTITQDSAQVIYMKFFYLPFSLIEIYVAITCFSRITLS
eukprot:TRINITY_DN2637_c0_g1_i14.p1 TRINITY_DN2637_c0_g1~~TRINITY_DN2637_c0_g1_i14.p1  ORF type:complete len:267 (-),score=-13.89 TRINITY_DN2637_c0_g1_i14:587-1273(-)